LAERRVQDFKDRIGLLKVSSEAKLAFKAIADRWLASVKHTIAPGTIIQRETRIANLASFFKALPIRNITEADCEAWATKRAPEIATATFVHELEVLRAVWISRKT